MIFPLLWLLVTNVSLRLLNSRGFEAVAFVDDVLVLGNGIFFDAGFGVYS